MTDRDDTPTPHPDDEALVLDFDDAVRNHEASFGGTSEHKISARTAYADADAALRRRLAELRARAEAAEKKYAVADECNGHSLRLYHAEKARAEAAERALAECRDTVKQLQDLAIWMTGCGFDFAALPYFQERRDLLTKEPT